MYDKLEFKNMDYVKDVLIFYDYESKSWKVVISKKQINMPISNIKGILNDYVYTIFNEEKCSYYFNVEANHLNLGKENNLIIIIDNFYEFRFKLKVIKEPVTELIIEENKRVHSMDFSIKFDFNYEVHNNTILEVLLNGEVIDTVKLNNAIVSSGFFNKRYDIRYLEEKINNGSNIIECIVRHFVFGNYFKIKQLFYMYKKLYRKTNVLRETFKNYLYKEHRCFFISCYFDLDNIKEQDLEVYFNVNDVFVGMGEFENGFHGMLEGMCFIDFIDFGNIILNRRNKVRVILKNKKFDILDEVEFYKEI